jgi:hypothetical protein
MGFDGPFHRRRAPYTVPPPQRTPLSTSYVCHELRNPLHVLKLAIVELVSTFRKALQEGERCRRKSEGATPGLGPVAAWGTPTAGPRAVGAGAGQSLPTLDTSTLQRLHARWAVGAVGALGAVGAVGRWGGGAVGAVGAVGRSAPTRLVWRRTVVRPGKCRPADHP